MIVQNILIIVVMQRIKSQSTCNPTYTISQSRPRSKKTAKGQTPDHSHNHNHHVSKHKHSHANNNTQNSMVSLKSGSKVSGGASMKNLRIVNNNQMSAKNSVQTTSRAHGTGSAISARILKQIIGYTNRTGTKNNKQGAEQTNRVNIDLDQELGLQKQKQRQKYTQKYRQKQRQRQSRYINSVQQEQKYERQEMKTSEQNKSIHTSGTKQRQTRNSSGGVTNKNKYNSKIHHRIVEQFSPMNMSQQHNQNNNNNNTNANMNMNMIVNMNRKNKKIKMIVNNGQQQQNRYESVDMEQHSIDIKGWKQQQQQQQVIQSQSKFNKQMDKVDKNSYLQISNQFLQITSPQHQHSNSININIINSINNSPTSMFSKCNNKYNDNSRQFNKYNPNVQPIHQIQHSSTQYLNSSEQLMHRKQSIVLQLQQCTTLLQSHYQFKYKQLIPLWNGIIQQQSLSHTLSTLLSQLNSQYTHIQAQQYNKKTQLFQLNRDQLNRKKQKQYASKTNKDKYINQAIASQEQLRLKLSSKADYEHVILFNQRVILTTAINTHQMRAVLAQMFQHKLTKKFGLIAKKQLANLSVYDSRLVQQYLKKIQQCQNNYHRLSQSYPSISISTTNYSSTQQHIKLQQIIQQIQQLTLALQQIKNNIMYKNIQLENSKQNINKYYHSIQIYIHNTNMKISDQYKMVQGESFDFQGMLYDNYQQQFNSYKQQLHHRDNLLRDLNDIDILIQANNNNMSNNNNRNNRNNVGCMDGNYNSIEQSQVTELFSRTRQEERAKTSRRESSSFESTPKHRQSCNIQNYHPNPDLLHIQPTPSITHRLAHL